MPRKNNPHSTPYKKPDYHSQNTLNDDDDNLYKTSKKIKLRTSLDIYNRLIHDKTLNIDLNKVFIGYSDKVLGDQEMCILDWTMIDKGGDIPMHHILYFVLILNNNNNKKNELILWERKSKLDRLYGSGNTNKQQSFKNVYQSFMTKNSNNNNDEEEKKNELNDTVMTIKKKKKRKKINNNNDEMSISIKYDAETTQQLSQRQKVKLPLAFHECSWSTYMNQRASNKIINNISVNKLEKNKDAFTLNEILTENECKTLIHLSESHQYVKLFGAAKGKSFRTNTRMITNDVSLANLLYERIKLFVPSTYKLNNEIWEICGLNERFRFCKYIKGQKFDIHNDKRCVLKHKSSFYTVNIYLNDGRKEYVGGKTLFFNHNKIVSSFVTGQTGMALCFNHYPQKYKHSGEALQNGVKYLVRTDVMYKRRN